MVLIDQEGVHPDSHQHGQGDAVVPRIGSVQWCNWEERGREDRNADQWDPSRLEGFGSGDRREKSVCGRWRGAKSLKTPTLDLMMRHQL